MYLKGGMIGKFVGDTASHLRVGDDEVQRLRWMATHSERAPTREFLRKLATSIHSTSSAHNQLVLVNKSYMSTKDDMEPPTYPNASICTQSNFDNSPYPSMRHSEKQTGRGVVPNHQQDP